MYFWICSNYSRFYCLYRKHFFILETHGTIFNCNHKNISKCSDYKIRWDSQNSVFPRINCQVMGLTAFIQKLHIYHQTHVLWIASLSKYTLKRLMGWILPKELPACINIEKVEYSPSSILCALFHTNSTKEGLPRNCQAGLLR